MSVYEDFKAILQNVIAPEVQEIKGELKAINGRLDSLEKVMDVRFEQTNEKIDNLVRQLNLEQRMSRIEAEQKKLPA